MESKESIKLHLTIPTFSRYKEGVNKKGTLATLILQNLSRGSNHGYRIAQDIKQTSKGVLDYKEGTLYPALHELEAEGLIASRNAEENGRTRCYYKLTDKGKRVLPGKRKNGPVTQAPSVWCFKERDELFSKTSTADTSRVAGSGDAQVSRACTKERIRAEIEAHYAESVREQRANGLSQSAAETEALAELGDARTAAKRFRKGHLTEWEAQ